MVEVVAVSHLCCNRTLTICPFIRFLVQPCAPKNQSVATASDDSQVPFDKVRMRMFSGRRRGRGTRD